MPNNGRAKTLPVHVGPIGHTSQRARPCINTRNFRNSTTRYQNCSCSARAICRPLPKHNAPNLHLRCGRALLVAPFPPTPA
eukprot:4032985-Lingulodinium_polyedra.AAC.1